MDAIVEFLDAILGGIDLIAHSLAVGGVTWGHFKLKPLKRHHQHYEWLARLCLDTIAKGALGLEEVQLAKLGVKAWLIIETLNASPFPAYFTTVQLQAGVLRLLFAICLGYYAMLASKETSNSEITWIIPSILLVPLVISGAWLTHGTGRFENSELLMLLTVLHQVAAGAWLGGIVQLLKFRFTKQRHAALDPVWPILLGKFWRIGAPSVALLLSTGIALGVAYINTWSELAGTGYCNLLTVKITLLMIVLVFAAANYSAARRCRCAITCADVYRRVPHYIKAEAFVPVSI